MNKTQLEEYGFFESTGVSGDSRTFALGGAEYMTIMWKITNGGVPGTPTVMLKGTNDPGGSPVWVNLLAASVTGNGPIVITPSMRYCRYKLVHSGGDAGDTITYHTNKYRPQ